MTDTIFAVSSGSPPAAIAVLRISGARAFAVTEMLVGNMPRPREAAVRTITDPASGDLLDRAIVLTFPGPRTATGEDIAELHLHGGRAVVRAVEAVLGRQQRLRPAQPGEFTRRALMAGRIDLTEAEGLGDLLAAETEAQRRAAIGSAEGAVSRAVSGWTSRTLDLAAAIEAAIDHEDEEDASDVERIVASVQVQAAALGDEIQTVTSRPGVERLRDGLRVVLAGPPNSGKSTLFNAMVDRDAAIVSPIAGTTRDRIEAPIVRNGTAWLFVDTAGLAEDTEDAIERIGIERSRDAMASADLIVWLGDDSPPATDLPVIAVHARADADGRSNPPPGRIAVSGVRADGVDMLWAELDACAADLLPAPDRLTLNSRQRKLCCIAAQHLHAASVDRDILLVAEALRQARTAFDTVTGRAHVEAMLDALFGRFCIGK